MSKATGHHHHVLALGLAGLVGIAAHAVPQAPDPDDPNVPLLVSMTPRQGDAAVAPGVTELLVEFDRDMAKTASWTGRQPSFPTPKGGSLWVTRRICRLTVTLEPGHSYALGINGPRHWGFKSTVGVSALRDVMLFRTTGGEPLPELTLEDNQKAIAELRAAIDGWYSYRDRLGLDWDAVFEQHRAKLESSKNVLEFMLEARDLLTVTDDQHISLQFEDATLAVAARPPQAVFSQRAVVQSLKDGAAGRVNPAIIKGRYPDKIGYLMITTWDRIAAEHLALLDKSLDSLSDSPGLIIDLRPNAGGDETIAQQFAGRFVAEETPYARNRNVDPLSPDGFSETHTRTFLPNSAGPRYTKPVCVLMGGYNMSSAESFLLMMRQVPGVTLIGERTYGSSGNPKPHRLSNGVTVMLPSWTVTDLEGRPIEGVGIEPDFPQVTSIEELRFGDPVIAAALEVLRGG